MDDATLRRATALILVVAFGTRGVGCAASAGGVHTAPMAGQPAIPFPEFSLPGLASVQSNVKQAFERFNLEGVLETAHQGGLVGLLRSTMHKRREPRGEVAWDTVGSKMDTRCSEHGYSEESRIRSGPCAKQVEADNLELTSRVLGTLALTNWNLLSSKDGIEVFKRSGKDIETGSYPPGVGAKKGDSSRFLCLWARGEINAPIAQVYHLFLSNDYVLQVRDTRTVRALLPQGWRHILLLTRVSSVQYNPMCEECRDVGWLDESTKITWATSKRVGPIAPRDFVTRCHYRKLRDDSLVRVPCVLAGVRNPEASTPRRDGAPIRTDLPSHRPSGSHVACLLVPPASELGCERKHKRATGREVYLNEGIIHGRMDIGSIACIYTRASEGNIHTYTHTRIHACMHACIHTQREGEIVYWYLHAVPRR